MARLDGQRFADLSIEIFQILDQERFTNESFENAFARLIGLVPNTDSGRIQALAGDLSTRTREDIAAALTNPDGSGLTEVATGQAGQTVVDGLLKGQDDNVQRLRSLASEYVRSLLDFIKRWSRVQRGQQARRIQRLIGTSVDPNDPALIGTAVTSDILLHENKPGVGVGEKRVDVGETVRKVNQGLRDIDLSKEDRTVGTLTLQLSLFDLVLRQLTFLVSSIPASRLGDLGGTFIRMLKTPLEGVQRNAQKVVRQRRALSVELTRLQNQEALITTGITLDTGEVLSLRNLLQGILFLTSKVEYNCKNCRFFAEGERVGSTISSEITRGNPTQGSICTYSTEEGKGRKAEPNDSCEVVWGLPGNDYWVASEDLVTEFKNELRKQGD